MSDRMPTRAEVMRVRRAECRQHGHSWDALRSNASEDPVSFICGNCGRSLLVVGSGVDDAE